MTTIPLDCPHCGTKKSGFQYVTAYAVGTFEFWCFAECSNRDCRKPIVYFGKNSSGKADGITAADVVEVHPTLAPLESPADIPDAAERAYLQGLSNLRMGDGFADPAGAMFRKALDQGIHYYDATLPQNLHAAIDKLHELGTITEAMKDWAHEIRDLGNDATHNDFTPTEAREMKDFTEMFLTYMFTMPEKIKRRRQRAGHAEQATD